MESNIQEIVAYVQQTIQEENEKKRKLEEKNRKQAEKKEMDKRLRNTKLLLRNYHSFQQYAEEHEGDDFTEEQTPVRELILNSQDIVSSIRMTTKRTIIMIRHLDNALKALQFICIQEEKNDKASSRHYDILHKRFIEQRAIEEIADEYGVNDRTVYKLIDTAAERLSILLFGVYGLKVE